MSLEEMKARHENRESRERILPAEHEKLQKIDALMGIGTKYDAMGHMSQEQIWTLSVYKAFHSHLVAGGVEGGIQPVLDLMEGYMNLSPSIDRMGRQEVVAALKGAPRYTQPWPEFDEPQDKGPGFWGRLFGGRKKSAGNGQQ